MTILNNGQEAKDLKRIADSLEKLVELQTSNKRPKPTQRKRETGIERDAEGNVQGFSPGGYTGYSKTQAKGFTTKLSEDVAKALKNEDEKAKDFLTKLNELFAKNLKDGDEEPKDRRADTIELKREKNKLVIRIAEIEGELKRRAERTMTERQIIDTITESLDVVNYEDMLDGFPFTSVNQPECKRTFTIELKPGATLLYVDGVISAESANKMAKEFLQVFEEARAEKAE